jgi:uncharacterized protein YukE
VTGPYRGLGFDPAPGDLTSVILASTALTDAADSFAAVAPALRRTGELSQAWQGDAAEAFRNRLAVPQPDRERGLRRAAGVLDRWADTLIANRRLAEELDDRAARLRARLDDARDLLQDKQNAADLAASPAAAAQAGAELAAVTTLVDDLRAALAEVLDRARTLQRDHQRAADAAADELTSVAPESLPGNRNLAGTVVGALDRTARTSAALAGLITSAERATRTAAPARAAGALAAALRSAG